MSEMNCPKCNGELESVSGDFNTGVVAPDGYRKSRYEEGFYCPRCRQYFDADDIEDKEGKYPCPWCDRMQTMDEMRVCSGYKPPYTEAEIRDCYSEPSERHKLESMLAHGSDRGNGNRS